MWIAKLSKRSPPPIASRAPFKAKAVDPSIGVSGSDCHGDGTGMGGALALAGWEAA